MTSRRSSAVSDVSAEDTEIQPNLVGVADSAPPAPDRGSRFLRPDVKRKGANSKKIKQPGGLLRFPEEKPVLRPFFEKPKSSGIAEFYLNPPRHIAVRQGVRTVVKGKFIYVGDEKFYIRGVTYGPFRPDERWL